ncbi:MAG TPA: phosphoserine phosphatase SerB, partial [Campylobacterales bacterium]|nr:phosphoserine phosphatase SerB [Campylobacterales bacterium]
ATYLACKKLGIDAAFSNVLQEKNGIFTGKVGGDMMFGLSNGDMLQRLQNILGIGREDTLVVGDGANDLSMFEFADTRVAFCAKPILKESATHIVDTKDLREILKISI